MPQKTTELFQCTIKTKKSSAENGRRKNRESRKIIYLQKSKRHAEQKYSTEKAYKLHRFGR